MNFGKTPNFKDNLTFWIFFLLDFWLQLLRLHKVTVFKYIEIKHFYSLFSIPIDAFLILKLWSQTWLFRSVTKYRKALIFAPWFKKFFNLNNSANNKNSICKSVNYESDFVFNFFYFWLLAEIFKFKVPLNHIKKLR